MNINFVSDSYSIALFYLYSYYLHRFLLPFGSLLRVNSAR